MGGERGVVRFAASMPRLEILTRAVAALVPLVSLVSLVSLVAAGCATITAESPLTVALGQPRAEAEAELRAHQYCHVENPPERIELYPRCDRPGIEFGDSWVSATYDGDRLVELRRWERFDDEAHALARWNQLVVDRTKQTPPSTEAGDALRVRGVLPPGTRTVAAFRVDDETVVGVYLLDPSPPENAALLERVVRQPRLPSR
jgi:hypothetical protein